MSAYVLDDGRRVVPAFLLNSESGGGLVTPPASFRLADGRTATAIVLVDEAGEIVPAPGGGQASYIETVPAALSATAAALTANRAYLMHFRVVGPLTLATISVSVGTASGNICAGVYSSDGTTLTRIATTGSVAVVGAAANQTLTLTTPVEVLPGTDYFLAVAVDNATATIRHVSSLDFAWLALGRRNISIDSAFPLPATIALASTGGSSRMPLLLASA
jgi:hypothetical protein